MRHLGIRYLAYGLESCPKTGTPHHQTFLYFKSPRSVSLKALNNLGNEFGPKHCSIAPMKGTFQQNKAYCSKEGQLTEFGERPNHGARNDLEEVTNSIRSGLQTVDDVVETNPWLFHNYGRTLDRAEGIALRRKWRTEMTEGIWYVGPTGSGKSHKCFHDYGDFHPSTHYVKTLDEGWWDGYKGQETVIFNEFRGEIAFSELLDLVDKWPKNVKVRNKESVPFLAKRLIVTSSIDPQDCYSTRLVTESWEQFDRRFNVIHLENRPIDRMDQK